jgi:hypothetical protein
MNTETELRLNYLTAYKKYVDYKASDHLAAFTKRVRELNIVSVDLPNEVSETPTQSDACRRWYYKLSQKYHPDKPGGNEMYFKKIRQLYEDGNEELLQKLTETDDFELVLVEELEKEIRKTTKTYYWIWATGTSQEKLMCELDYKLQMEINRMRLENDELAMEINRMRFVN